MNAKTTTTAQRLVEHLEGANYKAKVYVDPDGEPLFALAWSKDIVVTPPKTILKTQRPA
jgi:hypothetical protein